MRRRFIRLLVVALALIPGCGIGAGLWVNARLRASLPQIDGTRQISGLSAPVAVLRDGLGIPTIRGRSREDVARATGFVHAQDRFFQMDLARRRAAGELSALVGSAALPVDRDIRLHRFRTEARQALSLMKPQDRAMLDAYTAGVNSGLRALDAPPFEYAVLRQDPQAWRAEDSLLVVLSMFITLQDSDGSYEATLATMNKLLPQQMFEFLTSPGTEWDSPIVGNSFTLPPVPGADVYNLRARRIGKPPIELPGRRESVQLPTSSSQPPTLIASLFGAGPLAVGNWELGAESGEAAFGSNNFAIAGALSADGGALLANDMHLTVRVPNIWYRAVLEWQDGSADAEPRRLIGITLPGVPALVVGSNTHIAWGFTNTYADWSDIVLLEVDAADPLRYRTPDGWQQFERYDEVIPVAGQPDEHALSTWTIWGPVLGPDNRGGLRAYKWVAHSAERLAASVTPLEGARTVEEAFDAANGLGTPGQNLVVVDRSGRIGWSIYGSIPKRVGIDGKLPSSWADGTRGWNGWLEPEEYPRVLDPPDGRVWTANARVVDGEMLAKLGDGSYEVGSRARAIRDRLKSKDRFTARDLLDIQLDTRAGFLARWRDVMLRTLTPSALGSHPQRAELRAILDGGWTGRASPESAAYRFTRIFREQVSDRVMAFLLAECYEADPAFDHTTLRRREGPIWKLVSEKPLHLLDPAYATWDALLLAAIDAVIEQTSTNGTLAERAWSEYNVTAYRHPLSASLPFLGRLLDMPRQPLPGDLFTPRVHWGAIAASQRMVVSPGREADGIMHMPTGQSGHPLSPFYANSHEAWVTGEPTPFLPGPAVHTLTLRP